MIPIVVLPVMIVMTLLAIVLLWSIAALPAKPNNRYALLLWWAALVSVIGILLAFTYAGSTSPLHRAWVPPQWTPIVTAFIFIGVPFGSSNILWRIRRKNPDRISSNLAVGIVILLTVSSTWGYAAFNKTCVYYDYHHREGGDAWCPKSWQAH